MPVRRPLAVAAAALLLAGCSDDAASDPRAGSGPGPGGAADSDGPGIAAPPAPGEVELPVTRLLDAALHGHQRLAAPPAGRTVLLDPARDPPGTWHPYLHAERDPTPAERAAFEAESPILPDGTCVLGPRGGGRLAILPVEPGTDLIVTARVATHALVDTTQPGVAGSGAMIGVVEFVGDPGGPARAASLAARSHWTSPLVGESDEEVALYVDLKGATRFVGIALSQPMAQEAEDAWARFSALRVSTPGLVDVVHELTRDPTLLSDPERVPRGRVTIRHVERPSLLLLPGAEVAFDVLAPGGPATFETGFGLVPHGTIPGGRKVVLRWEFRDAAAGDDAPPLLAAERTLVTLGLSNSRWGRLVLPLPPEAAGRRLRARFSCDPVEPDTLAVAAIAAPRLVPDAAPRVGPNVVLVSLDTLRSDRLGCYGYGRPTSPNIDAFARTATRFTDVWANGPFTLPSHVSMLSGQLPSVHGVESTGDRIDPARTHTLAQVLRAWGWATGGFTAGGYLDSEFGFGRGFQRYSALEPAVNLASPRVLSMLEKYPGLDAEMLEESDADAIVGWIERNARQSFFLFVHSYAAHQFDPPDWAKEAMGDADLPPRVPGDDVGEALASWNAPDPATLATLSRLYDASVRQADALFGRVVDAIDDLGLADDTIVVLTSDHGKELGEHGRVAHGHSLYEELLQIPLVVRVPGRAPAVVDDPAMLVDVVPTVLAAAGVPLPPGVQGRDLFGSDAGLHRALLAEVDDVARKVAFRDGSLKTIWGPDVPGTAMPDEREEETFDLARDPGERSPLPPDARRVAHVRELVESLRALGASLGDGTIGAAALSPDTEAQLRELGYLGDGQR